MFHSCMEIIKWATIIALGVLGAGLFIALIIGAVFFDVEVASVASWFIGAVGIIFVLGLICALFAAIVWFLISKPYVGGIFVAALLAVFLGLVIMWLVEKPAIDLGTYLDPIFSFFK